MQLKLSTGTLRSVKDFEGFAIRASDGDIGKVHDLFFDDECWAIRYLVVDTGHWLPGRKVLLPPSVMDRPNHQERHFTVPLTREQVRTSPDVDTAMPVSRQRELELHAHYGWPFYMNGGGIWPSPIMPMPLVELPAGTGNEQEDTPHLRSVREITGYTVSATDGDAGVVDDFIADDKTWNIRFLVVAAQKWLPGRKVLIFPEWITGRVRWSEQKVETFISRETVRNSPDFDSRLPVSRDYETRLCDYYRQAAHWQPPAPGQVSGMNANGP